MPKGSVDGMVMSLLCIHLYVTLMYRNSNVLYKIINKMYVKVIIAQNDTDLSNIKLL